MRTLGAADLVGPNGHRVNSVVHQPKRFALLVYLAMAARGEPLRRDTVLAVFWPEESDANARHRLKQAVYYLRQSLGSGAVITEGKDNLRLDFDILSCDALVFEAAVAAGEHREALEMYRGDLLPGFFVSGSREFEAWLESERSRFRRLAVEATRGAAGTERSRGNAAGVAHWARRLAELAGTNEALFREAIGHLGDVGDRAGAAEVYAGFERLLAAELEMQPSSETRSLADGLIAGDGGPAGAVRGGAGASITVARSETAAARPLSQANSGAPAPPATSGAPAPPATSGAAPAIRGDDAGSGPPGGGRRKRLLAGLLAVLSLVVLARWHLAPDGPNGAVPLPGPDHTAVKLLEFEHLGTEPAAAAVAQALPIATRRHLMRARGFVVLSADDATPRRAEAASVHRGQGSTADGVEVGGSVRVTRDEIRVELALWDQGSRRLIHASSMRHPAGELDAAVEILAMQVASTVRTELGRVRRARASRAAAPDPRAAELMELAEGLVREARDLRSRGFADAAAAGYLKADSLLAAAESTALDWPAPSVARARAAAERAWLVLMPPVADRSLARVEFERALEHASRAVSRNGRDASANETRGTVAYWMWSTLDLDESGAAALIGSAEEDLRRALEVDPARIRAWSLLSDMAHKQTDFAGAFWAAKQGFELDSYHEHARELLFRLFLSAYEIGDRAGAQDWCAELGHRFPAGATSAYCALALVAWRDGHEPADADGAWLRIQGLDASPPNVMIPRRLEMMVASILAGAGRPDSAEAVIARAREGNPADPELLHLEAHARILLGQPDSAASLLSAYVGADPARRVHVAASRRFEGLGHIASSSSGLPDDL